MQTSTKPRCLVEEYDLLVLLLQLVSMSLRFRGVGHLNSHGCFLHAQARMWTDLPSPVFDSSSLNGCK